MKSIERYATELLTSDSGMNDMSSQTVRAEREVAACWTVAVSAVYNGSIPVPKEKTHMITDTHSMHLRVHVGSQESALDMIEDRRATERREIGEWQDEA